MADRLAGKTAVVTGASRGLGLAVARAFEAEGARVITAAKSSGVDVSKPEDVARDPRVKAVYLGEEAHDA